MPRGSWLDSRWVWETCRGPCCSRARHSSGACRAAAPPCSGWRCCCSSTPPRTRSGGGGPRRSAPASSGSRQGCRTGPTWTHRTSPFRPEDSQPHDCSRRSRSKPAAASQQQKAQGSAAHVRVPHRIRHHRLLVAHPRDRVHILHVRTAVAGGGRRQPCRHPVVHALNESRRLPDARVEPNLGGRRAGVLKYLRNLCRTTGGRTSVSLRARQSWHSLPEWCSEMQQHNHRPVL